MESRAEIASAAPREQIVSWYSSLTDDERAGLEYRWDFWGRPNQQVPPGDWSIWLMLTGRGWGKTRTGAETIRQFICGDTPLARGPRGDEFIAIIAETAADARDILVEGPSGILRVHPKDFRPEYEPSKRRLTWPNGTQATLYNGTEPDQLRGPQHSLAWCDELAKYQFPSECWDMLEFGMRMSNDPRTIITTTPRPLNLIKGFIDESEKGTVYVTRGSLYENRSNLAAKFVNRILDKYAGTRLGRQEIDGEIVDDVPGAMWTRALLDEHRKKWTDKIPEMQRLVVAIDPAAKRSEDEDETSETGIIVAGIGTDGHGYVIDDRTCRLGPHGWAKVAVAAYDRYEADCIIAEINNGGEMVSEIIKAVRATVPVEVVHASRGKVVRAEPVAALYEQGRVSHIGQFPALEDQLVTFTPFGIEGDGGSDRADALVWALTKLFPSLVARAKRPQTVPRRTFEKDRSKVTGY